MIVQLLAIMLGGALGALARYGTGLLAAAWLGHRWPYGTLLVNLIGSLLIGVVFVWIGTNTDNRHYWHGLLIAGFLGSFTTFSAFSLDLLLLLEQGRWEAASLYILVSVLVGLAAVYAGFRLGRLVF